MKKSIRRTICLVLLLLCASVGFSSFVYKPSGIVGHKVDVREIVLNGHSYVIASASHGHGCGVSIIHSESCSCRKHK